MVRSFITTSIALNTLASTCLAATPEEWRTRSIYQLMTDRFSVPQGTSEAACDPQDRRYCGGTWKGIEQRLDYIQDLGFDAVWISPISENIDDNTAYGEAYHGYWTKRLDSLNSRFGTEADLVSLVTEAHRRGLYIMVDNVPNHFAHGAFSGQQPSLSGTSKNIDVSDYSPFNQPSQFHDFCWIDYANATSVTQCWMGDAKVPLLDLNTDDPQVNAALIDYVRNTTSSYKIDGMRVDAVKSIKKEFWRPWNDAAGVFAMAEVYTGDPAVQCDFQQDALDSVLNFATWNNIVRNLNSTSGDMTFIKSAMENTQQLCQDSTLLGSFLENADIPRFKAYTQDLAHIQNAATFMFLADGIPVLYYGFEQGFSGDSDPANREALWSSGYSNTTVQYGWVKQLNTFRRSMMAADGAFAGTAMSFLSTSDAQHVLAFTRGDMVAVVNNLGAASGGRTVTVNTPYAAGTSVRDLWNTTRALTVAQDGSVQLALAQGAPVVLYPQSLQGCVTQGTTTACRTSKSDTRASARPSSAVSRVSMTAAATSATANASTTARSASSRLSGFSVLALLPCLCWMLF